MTLLSCCALAQNASPGASAAKPASSSNDSLGAFWGGRTGVKLAGAGIPGTGTLAELAGLPTPDLSALPSAPVAVPAQPATGSSAGEASSLPVEPAPAAAAPAGGPMVLITPAPPKPDLSIPAPPRHPALDKKFWLLAALTTALTTTDIEFTQHCLHSHQCVELDPLMPHSRAGMYAATYPANAFFFYWSYRRRESGKRLWWLAPVLDISSHAVGTWSGARFLGK